MTALSLVDLRLLPDALADPRLAHGVAELLLVSYRAAMGRGERRECFGCCKPWSPKRSIAAIVTVEEVGGENALMAGLCHACASQGRTAVHRQVLAALQRDLGVPPGATRAVHAEGQA